MPGVDRELELQVLGEDRVPIPVEMKVIIKSSEALTLPIEIDRAPSKLPIEDTHVGEVGMT